MISPVFTEYQGKRFVFFSSPHSDNGCLSNWYESSFLLDSRDFKSAEQAFLYFKALSSGDEATALRVFAMDEPRYFARLNHQIRPFDPRRWAEQREGTMRRIVHEKFAQSEELTEFLLATDDATIVNCSKNPLWSCGLQITQPERLDTGSWLGQNLLGTMLMELREQLRPAEPAPQPKLPTEPEPEPAQASQVEQAVAPAAPESDAAQVEAASAPAEDGTPAAPVAEAAAGKGAAVQATDTSEQAEPSAEPQAVAEPAASTDETDAADTTATADAPTTTNGPAPDQTSELSTAAPTAGDAVARRQDAVKSEAAAVPEPPADAERTELIPNPHATDKTTVIPNLVEAKLAPEPVAVPQTASASSGPDPVVARYAQGDYPTADELADGSILKHLIVSFTKDNSAAVRHALMQCLRDSVVAVTAVKVDPLVASTAPVRDDGLSDPLIMDNGNTYRPSILENDGGQRWFPTFSSVTEISDELGSRTSVIMLPMSQCVELARTHGGLAGIVVNVFTENLILPGRTCDYIAGLDPHAA